MKILVVDDHAYNRDLLSFILDDEGHQCVEAEDGKRACDIYRADKEIDLVLMDINMPVMDGISAAKILKADSAERFVPIIFVTALDDAEVVARCLGAGGDDFVPKPVNENILLAKIKAHSRSQVLYANLQKANKKLVYHQQLMDREHAIIEHMFTKGLNRNKTQCDNMVSYTSPMSLFDGDMVLSGASPSGGSYFMVGDFTGHGLAAAMGSLPVTEIFYRLISHQASISQIATEINSRLIDLLPENMFCCAAIVHVDLMGARVTLWSGGMNDVLCVKRGASTDIKKIASMHMPLGILEPEEFDDSPRIFDLEVGEKMYIFTDGVNEAANSEGEEFGLERLEDIVLAGGDDVVARVTTAVSEFHAGCDQSDDMSMIEFTGGNLIHRSKCNGEIIDVGADCHKAQSFPWSFTMELKGHDLRKTNIVGQILGFVASIQGIELHQDKIFTIVSELYSNALEHGVLGLSSDLKHSADGFEQYYKLREQRLAEIDGGFITVIFTYRGGDPNTLELIITDSGEGFDANRITLECEQNDDMHGRGMYLLKSLCATLEYSNGGRTATAVYELSRHG